MPIAIVGCGIAGTLLCLELQKEGKRLNEITIFDPFLDGGALSHDWNAIYSNTRWEQITEVMKEYKSSRSLLDELNLKYSPETRVLLSDLGWLLQESLRPFLPEMNLHLEKCSSLIQTETGWQIETSTGKKTFQTVFLCQGGRPKYLDFGKPTIALETALDPVRLQRLVRSNQSVAVFGLAHSGTLICKHLLDLQLKVYGIYKKEKPFYFARDDEYDGIKQESADIADALLKNPPSNFELVSYQNTPQVVKIISKVHWIVCAIGFEGSPIQIIQKDGTSIRSETYNPETAQIADSLFGFGLAYPGITTYKEKTYKDVSIPSFVQQIRRCLPSILSKS